MRNQSPTSQSLRMSGLFRYGSAYRDRLSAAEVAIPSYVRSVSMHKIDTGKDEPVDVAIPSYVRSVSIDTAGAEYNRKGRRSRNPFVCQVCFDGIGRAGDGTAGAHRRNPFVCQVCFDPAESFGRLFSDCHRRNPFVCQVCFDS